MSKLTDGGFYECSNDTVKLLQMYAKTQENLLLDLGMWMMANPGWTLISMSIGDFDSEVGTWSADATFTGPLEGEIAERVERMYFGEES